MDNVVRYKPDPATVGNLLLGIGSARLGEPFTLWGLCNFPIEVLERCLRLYTRFGRDPFEYLTTWDRFRRGALS